MKNTTDREAEKRERYERNRETLKRMHEKLRRERFGAGGPPGGLPIGGGGGGFDGGYLALKNKQLGLPSGEGKYQKVTMEVLGRMHYTDFNMGNGVEDDFNP